MNTVTVIGSINMDTTLRLTKMPKPGETMHAHEHEHLLLEVLELTVKDSNCWIY